jgi:2-polyprenyl-6-methoxyphenol hydroxylase-like FAD-dependent oxidoreductase
LEQDSPGAPIIRAERLRLRNWLATNLQIQWGKRVKRIEHDDEAVSVFFEDGTNAKGDILVGADGVKSVGRSSALMFPLGFDYLATKVTIPFANFKE